MRSQLLAGGLALRTESAFRFGMPPLTHAQPKPSLSRANQPGGAFPGSAAHVVWPPAPDALVEISGCVPQRERLFIALFPFEDRCGDTAWVKAIARAPSAFGALPSAPRTAASSFPPRPRHYVHSEQKRAGSEVLYVYVMPRRSNSASRSTSSRRARAGRTRRTRAAEVFRRMHQALGRARGLLTRRRGRRSARRPGPSAPPMTHEAYTRMVRHQIAAEANAALNAGPTAPPPDYRQMDARVLEGRQRRLDVVRTAGLPFRPNEKPGLSGSKHSQNGKRSASRNSRKRSRSSSTGSIARRMKRKKARSGLRP